MKKLNIIIVLLMLVTSTLKAQTPYDQLPFSTDENHITVWNGESYAPFFIKGMNLGISKPGTFPGELAATRTDYSKWLSLIQQAGFNTIRLYTLHYPHFYQVLDSFNIANPKKPIYFFQGIWLEEEIPNYDEDLYSLTASFQEELTGNIEAVHGNTTIAPRPGKASGSYDADVSKYLIGYIVGREIHPPEVWRTNSVHSESSYLGNHLSLFEGSPSEVWMTNLLDDVLTYEQSQFDMMHPISFSSWPTLDPLDHPDEPNRYEDSVTIDLRRLDISNAPGGYFASYHAYPYYPDFVSGQTSYQNENDYLGQNSYLAYIKELKNHYSDFPLLIAEFGTSSSWGVAHYAHSGIHHGGASEVEQGEAYLRMFLNIQESKLAGGIQFAWIDEWFKRTWITDPFDHNPDSRVNWHNITAAEQNFGLLGYRKSEEEFNLWESICSNCPLETIDASVGYDFFRIKLNMPEAFNSQDTLWIGLDTYSVDLGESILPNGAKLNHRAEFAMMITQDQAVLYVTEAYDTYGIWHGTSSPNQLYQSTSTDGSPWRIVRWKNNNTLNEVQFIGRLGVNRLNLPLKSTDAVIIKEESIEIRLPWTLLQFVDPSKMKVMHDDRTTAIREEAQSEGIAIDLLLNTQSFSSTNRYSWENWSFPTNLEEYKKKSFDIIEQGLESIPSAPIAHADNYELTIDDLTVSNSEGVLSNDVSFGASIPQAYLYEHPKNGLLQLNADGSFQYQPVGNFSGVDRFEYRLRAGPNWSQPIGVTLDVHMPLAVNEQIIELVVYPNPGSEFIKLKTDEKITKVEVYDGLGNLIISQAMNQTNDINIQQLSNGIYFLKIEFKQQQVVHKFIKK